MFTLTGPPAGTPAASPSPTAPATTPAHSHLQVPPPPPPITAPPAPDAPVAFAARQQTAVEQRGPRVYASPMAKRLAEAQALRLEGNANKILMKPQVFDTKNPIFSFLQEKEAAHMVRSQVKILVV